MKGLVDARMVKSAKQFDRAVQAAEQAVQLKAQVGGWDGVAVKAGWAMNAVPVFRVQAAQVRK